MGAAMTSGLLVRYPFPMRYREIYVMGIVGFFFWVKLMNHKGEEKNRRFILVSYCNSGTNPHSGWEWWTLVWELESHWWLCTQVKHQEIEGKHSVRKGQNRVHVRFNLTTSEKMKAFNKLHNAALNWENAFPAAPNSWYERINPLYNY